MASSRPVTHRARGLARREALLDAAVEIVAERGIAGATHRAIAERAGVPSSTTTYFFASIDDLLLAAIQRFTQRRVEQFTQLAALLGDPGRTPEEVATLFAEALASAPLTQEITQFEAYLDAGRRHPTESSGIAEVVHAFERVAESALEAMGVATPQAAAPALVALVDGYSLRRLALGEPTDPEAVAETLLRLIDSFVDRPAGVPREL